MKISIVNSNKNNICVGTGLVALDVILNGKPETPPKLHTGGSCGNVMAILAYLGWNSYPVARLALNEATKEIVKDLTKWNVNTSLISKTNDGSTPIIIHRILKDKQGLPKHKFEFKDPETFAWLPGYKPVLRKDVDSISAKLPEARVFYFDRYNRGAIDLAKANKKNGALIFFEPSSIHDEKSFRECLAIADIVKFSNDRIPNYSKLFPISEAPLEIETRGAEGLQYRYSISKKSKTWQKIKSFKLDEIKDAAGAGDWCSAGIIFEICRSNRSPFIKSDPALIESALQYGQLLGALNCAFDGARGMMYQVEKKEFDAAINNLLKQNKPSLSGFSFSEQHSSIPRKPIKVSSLY